MKVGAWSSCCFWVWFPCTRWAFLSFLKAPLLSVPYHELKYKICFLGVLPLSPPTVCSLPLNLQEASFFPPTPINYWKTVLTVACTPSPMSYSCDSSLFLYRSPLPFGRPFSYSSWRFWTCLGLLHLFRNSGLSEWHPHRRSSERLVNCSPMCPDLGLFLSCFLVLDSSHHWFWVALGSFPKPFHVLICKTRIAVFYNPDSNRMAFSPSELHELAHILALHSAKYPASLWRYLRGPRKPRFPVCLTLTWLCNLIPN